MLLASVIGYHEISVCLKFCLSCCKLVLILSLVFLLIINFVRLTIQVSHEWCTNISRLLILLWLRSCCFTHFELGLSGVSRQRFLASHPTELPTLPKTTLTALLLINEAVLSSDHIRIYRLLIMTANLELFLRNLRCQKF